jgi:hypothetical protein
MNLYEDKHIQVLTKIIPGKGQSAPQVGFQEP